MHKVLIFPGSFKFVKNYGDYDGWNIWVKSYPPELPMADYYISGIAGECILFFLVTIQI